MGEKTATPPPPAALDHFFSPDGPLAASLPGYEERPEQTAMARAIVAAIADGEKLVVEAGTGVGKTLAYLVAALQSGKKAVVSTGTKNLQEQILKKDLPILETATGHQFDVVVMKGRSNYLCEARYLRATRQRALPGVVQLFPDQRLLTQIAAWRNETQTGDRAELSSLPDSSHLWPELTVTSEQCSGRRCAEFERCWVTRIRRRAMECELLVVNHHLYFADAALRLRLPELDVGILPPHEVVIFDEAHEVDEIAAQYFGYSFSDGRVKDLCADIRRATAAMGDWLARSEPHLRRIETTTPNLLMALPFGRARQRLRRKQINAEAVAHHRALDEALARLEARLAEADGEEIPAFRRRVAELGAELGFVLFSPPRHSTLVDVELLTDRDPLDQREPSQDDPARIPFVRFTEATARNRAVVARPLDIAPMVARCLETRTAIFTSATLAVDQSLSHFEKRVGLTTSRELVVDSPFDYPSQTRLYLPDDLPGVDDPAFSAAAVERAAQLIHACGGGAFVLCTSNRMVEVIADRLRQRTPLTVLTQGTAPRGHLLARFCGDGDAILVATMSFWRGVDVPGSPLRLVIIDRLPFASPGDPVVEARIEYLRHSGHSPFRVYQLPQAALLLRQGFGRLIRSRHDRGMVAVLDQRLSRKGYGKLLLRSLPSCPILTQRQEAQTYLAQVRAAFSPTK